MCSNDIRKYSRMRRSIYDHSLVCNLLCHAVKQSDLKYRIPLKTISSGNMTGDIVVVRERKTKNEFALKTIQKSNMSEKMLNVLRREVEILASLDHVSFFFSHDISFK